jgi:uncharacterized protein YyaL (SSP411 family)
MEIVARAGSYPGQAPMAFDTSGACSTCSGPIREVAIVGEQGSLDTRALLNEVVAARYLPNVVLAAADPEDGRLDRVPLLRGRMLKGGEPTAFVCERFACKLPVTTPEALASQL